MWQSLIEATSVQRISGIALAVIRKLNHRNAHYKEDGYEQSEIEQKAVT